MLPTTLLVSVLSFLPLSDVASASSICALLFVLAQDDRLWRAFCLRRWRPLLPYTRYRLLPHRDWAALEAGDADDEEKEERPLKEEKTSPLAAADDDGPTFPQSGGWKGRYIAGEMDLCRSFLTLSELLSHRWRFRFHFGFDDGNAASYPVYTAQGRVRNRGDEWYNWRWVDREKGLEDTEPTVFEKRRFVGRDALGRLLSKPRPYWLRSSGAPATSAEETTPAFDATPAPPAAFPLRPSSALRSPALPPRRYEPGHPFFALTPLQLRDCSCTRRLQINQYPPRTITRLPDGGWQMLNQYIIMLSVDPEKADEEEDEVDREVEADDMLDDDDDDAVDAPWMYNAAAFGGHPNGPAGNGDWDEVAEDVLLLPHQLEQYRREGYYHFDD